jgi:glycosyltransferase involved in cell wall biosynthesis
MAGDRVRKTRILLLGPGIEAVSGVSTHLNQLFGSSLANDFALTHLQVGSEGRRESTIQRAARLMSSPFQLAARIIRDRPDIVHINASLDHKSFPRDAAYLAVARTLRRKVVFQVHGGEMPGALYAGSVARTRFIASVLRGADVVVLLARSELMAYSAFVPDVRLQIIANAVQLNQQAELPKSSARGPIRLAYVGRLVSTKGITDCITAAQLLRDSGRDFTLTIAGIGPEEDELRKQARALTQDGLVEFVGALSGKEKDELWRESDVFVFPTFHLEGLPYSLLESMAAGAVPITTRVGAQTDVMEDGVHGLFVPPHNPHALFEAIVKLDDDRQLLHAMSDHGRKRVRDCYGTDRLAEDFRVLYRSLEHS